MLQLHLFHIIDMFLTNCDRKDSFQDYFESLGVQLDPREYKGVINSYDFIRRFSQFETTAENINYLIQLCLSEPIFLRDNTYFHANLMECEWDVITQETLDLYREWANPLNLNYARHDKLGKFMLGGGL